MPPKSCPDSRMLVGYPMFAFVDPDDPEQFDVLSDRDFKFVEMFDDKIPR